MSLFPLRTQCISAVIANNRSFNHADENSEDLYLLFVGLNVHSGLSASNTSGK